MHDEVEAQLREVIARHSGGLGLPGYEEKNGVRMT